MLRTTRTLVRGTAAAVLLSLMPVSAAFAADAAVSVDQGTVTGGELQTADLDAADLKPGQFLWAAQMPDDGAIQVVVSIALQKAYVFRGGRAVAVTTVSTGQPGHETPTGSFTILQKNKDHRSNIYNNAPMPFMQRLTWDGIALHAGAIPGHPASHGCVRLPKAFAQQLFGMTQLGAQVWIIDDAPSSAAEALQIATAPTELLVNPGEVVQQVANTVPVTRDSAKFQKVAETASVE